MDAKHDNHARFLRIWGWTITLALALTILFNYAMDPYGLLDTPRHKGFNAKKPLAPSHVRIAKPYQVVTFAPKTLNSGNSRPEIGLDPANSCWEASERPVFNIGLPGSGIYQQARIIQHALAGGSVQQVFWGLDFVDFHTRHEGIVNRWEEGNSHLEFEKRLRVTPDGNPNPSFSWRRLTEHFQTLVSLTALKDSLATLLAQRDPYSSDIRRDGFNPARDYLGIIRWEGQPVLFEQKWKELEKMFSRSNLSIYAGNDRWSPEFESVERLLKFAAARKVRVTLFINPYHESYLDIIEASGHQPAFQEWKVRLAELAQDHGTALWDFSLRNSITGEDVPDTGGKKSIMRWFWEPAHYRKTFGDLMLSLMLGRACAPELPPEKIGRRLTPE
ncbi:MAG: hypothetical protein DSZ02_03575 [Gammaproteobacteria bacterium]|nr:MAG: hypothetical protein DSZ02_03575 [Gammaproteobacteria bacterium]